MRIVLTPSSRLKGKPSKEPAQISTFLAHSSAVNMEANWVFNHCSLNARPAIEALHLIHSAVNASTVLNKYPVRI
jgi:hypothetical protein